MLKYLKNIIRLVYLIRKTKWSGISLKEQKNVMWIKIWGLRYFLVADFTNTCGIINAISLHGLKFNIKFGNKLGNLSGKNVYFVFSRHNDPNKFQNHTEYLRYITRQLEEQNCTVMPNNYEVRFWENKTYMHKRFDELSIPSPKTYLLKSLKDFGGCDLSYPFLIKDEHSRSSIGIYKIESEEQLRNTLDEGFFKRNKTVIAQELLNMRRDLRITFVGSEIVLHYWRINLGKEWKPTATSYGSDVDFVSFPEKWRQFLTDQFLKLNLRAGAFDVAWQNDDLDSEPRILEVSPAFQPNPPVDLKKEGLSSYADFKNRISLFNSYESRYVDIVFMIARKQIALALNG
jgi:glutathione synthase/RimK-type ligase-like ATP-grasp enzyme